MGHDYAVPLATRDLGGEQLAAVARQVLLAGNEQPGVGIELEALAAEVG